MRRISIGSIGLILAVSAVWGSGEPARAQQQIAQMVTLRLRSQSVWNGPKRPLVMSVDATNNGPSALTSLSIELIIDARVRSRSEYELSLKRDDVGGELLALPFVEPGTLEPRQTRTFTLRQPLDAITAFGDSALYPLRVELRSQDTAVASLRSPMIFLTERPKVPLALAWAWSLSLPPQLDPQGRILPGPVEAAIAPGGRLRAMSDALSALGSRPVDLVLSSVLVEELRRMAGGYRAVDRDGRVRTTQKGGEGAADAAAVLDSLKEIGGRPETETVALPFGDAVLPTLGLSGLLGDLPTLMARGRGLVQSVIGASPSVEVVRPPLSALDASSFVEAAAAGAITFLLDPGAAAAPLGPTGRPLPLVTLAAGHVAASAIVADAGVPRVAAITAADPKLAARAALGELAATWFEAPGTPGRGAAVVFGERTNLPPSFYGAFATLVKSSPWLKPQTASTFIHAIPSAGRESLPDRPYRAIAHAYVNRLLAVRDRVGQFQSAARGSGSLVDRLKGDLLLSEGGLATTNPALGRRYLDSVDARIDLTYRAVRINVIGGLITLAGPNVPIPITFSNRSTYPIVGDIRLLSDRRLTFVGEPVRQLIPPRSSTVLKFRVHAHATGRIPLKIQLRTSRAGSADTITETDIVVRSTAYNRVALFLTIGAAVFLLAWWGRRFLPRRTA